MQKLLLLLISISLPLFVSAQAPDFFTEGSRWVYNTSESFEPGQPFIHGCTEQNIIHGDTLIDGVLYYKLYSTFHFSTTAILPYPQPPLTTFSQAIVGPTFIRHDTFENKVYYLPSVDSTERIIYDFNLQVGEATPMQSPFMGSTGVIDSIENGSFFGTSVKKFYTSKNEGGPVAEENYIIEGMGGSNGLTYYQPVLLLVSGGIFTTSLVCFQSGDSIYSRINGECPFLEYVSTVNDPSEEYIVSVSPNPTQGFYSLLVSEGLRNANFIVTDCFGRRIQSSVLTGQTAVGQLPSSGIYFWFLEKEGRLIRSGKLICE